jgi:primosomal protein N''
MDTSKLKSFAPAVRRKLHEAIGRKLDIVLAAKTPDLRTTYEKQVASLREKSEKSRKALIEAAAYTWFNRLTALRYLDAQGWHPFNAKILMPGAPGETQPEVLKMVNAGSIPDELKEHANQRRILDLLNRNIPSQNPEQEAYRLLVLGACRFYHATLPSIFAKVDDETELLLPDDLLGDLSITAGFRSEIQDSDCDDVEVIGWLYQFYISEEKDTVMARKSAVPTEDIPAVTQLFTPHWIVRYLVENSLGRLWLLNRPTSGLKAHMPYYIEADAETDILKIAKPEEIKLVDPAVGSGHMLTCAFDLLYLIYEEEGYPASDIPRLILKHNLHGIEICPRAAQLAELALAFKARKKARRFFQQGVFVRPQITELQEIRFNGDELRDYIKELKLGALFDQGVIKLLHQFEEAKNFGSLIQPCLDAQSIGDIRRAIETKDLGGQLFLRETHKKVTRVLLQAEALTQRYSVSVANPPYMGRKGMNKSLAGYLDLQYQTSSFDLLAAFCARGFTLTKAAGLSAMVTLDSWLFLSSFEDMRTEIIREKHILNILYIGWNCFPDGHVYNRGVAFVISNNPPKGKSMTTGINLSDVPATVDKKELLESRLISGEGRHKVLTNKFRVIPGNPLAFWLPDSALSCFESGARVADDAEVVKGLDTCDNQRFIRFWYEVSSDKSFNAETKSCQKWFTYCKGGEYRKWYGNYTHVVNWEHDGLEIRNLKTPDGKQKSRPQSTHRYFTPGITFSSLTSSYFSCRVMDNAIFGGGGSGLFSNDRLYIAALLNSNLNEYFLSALNPTLNMLVGDIGNIPLANISEQTKQVLRSNTERLIHISREDWDARETSWSFQSNTLISHCLKYRTIEKALSDQKLRCEKAIEEMLRLEAGNNSILIDGFGLNGALSPDVACEQVVLSKAEAGSEIVAFISYAVGCMMGRYSLDQPGLVLADAGDTLEQYLEKVGKSMEQLKFQPDDDGILPVMDVEWFEDDIVSRFEAFLVATFGKDKVTENIQFIEKSLDTDIRSYFLGGFYKDHLQTYKKRPIYWMAQSPKKAFCALIYLHRYTKDTLSLLLNSYLRPYILKLNSRIEILAQTEASAGSAREKTAARKELEKLRKYVRECEEWERDVLLPAAQSRIELDLDDGVKVNYLKLGDVLTPIPGLAAKEDE